jgi:hypothetical protein
MDSIVVRLSDTLQATLDSIAGENSAGKALD